MPDALRATTKAEARQAKVLTKDEAPRIAINIARGCRGGAGGDRGVIAAGTRPAARGLKRVERDERQGLSDEPVNGAPSP
jgi:hypothetical protein